jgi:hypothetical protein
MTDIPTSLAKFQGPDSNAAKYERQAKAFWAAGGVILSPYQMDELSPAARGEVERVMEKAYGKRPRT